MKSIHISNYIPHCYTFLFRSFQTIWSQQDKDAIHIGKPTSQEFSLRQLKDCVIIRGLIKLGRTWWKPNSPLRTIWTVPEEDTASMNILQLYGNEIRKMISMSNFSPVILYENNKLKTLIKICYETTHRHRVRSVARCNQLCTKRINQNWLELFTRLWTGQLNYEEFFNWLQSFILQVAQLISSFPLYSPAGSVVRAVSCSYM